MQPKFLPRTNTILSCSVECSMELEEVCNVSVELSGEHSNKTGKKFNAATFKMLLIAFGSYLLKYDDIVMIPNYNTGI